MAIMKNHKKALSYNQGPAMVRIVIMDYLLHEDNPISLAVFLMLINPGAYEPKMGRKFEY
jgi:hypothetical protein